ncbi:hypothetical protein [Cellulomonas composti]|uniref:Uncharacterized protein n=1 Tax=Cellulomonas composti TaxID=266130 RepID=A0A511J985_9CELL|nr:hypothetical protein [Cellulomonas composti]GEL94554.1 hypothetical protein CCO02nite_12120 [Cellulomonas composti]
MSLTTTRRRLAAAAAGLLVVVPLALVGPGASAAQPATLAPAASAAATRSCSASASPSNPRQYSWTTIKVAGTTKGAKVTTTAHYKTTTTKHSATADAKGKASVDYYVSGATVGYRVRVDVVATKGSTRWTCSTSFTPRAR